VDKADFELLESWCKKISASQTTDDVGQRCRLLVSSIAGHFIGLGFPEVELSTLAGIPTHPVAICGETEDGA
jgi:hypothetical protein